MSVAEEPVPPRPITERALGRVIERGLGGYRRPFVRPDTSRPSSLPRPLRVAVVGGGLAGLLTAHVLAERGATVTLFEKEGHLGGKLGGWREDFVDPETGEAVSLPVDHGFHAFFPHYYNFSTWLERLGIRNLRNIGEYRILRVDGSSLSFDERGKAPGLNVLGLARQGLFGLSDVLPPTGRMVLLERFFRYHPERTFESYDHVSFQSFVERTRLPKALALVFTTFSRAFFADPDRMSLAELIKAFHFYYLSHDRGLLYDFLAEGYASGLIQPLRAHLDRLGVTVRLGASIGSLARREGSLEVNGERFDDVVLAAPAAAVREILLASAFAREEAPAFVDKLGVLRPGQRYAILRLFSKRRVSPEGPVFVATERKRLLDSVTFLHRVDPELDRWCEGRRGVYELHSYAVPDDIPDADIGRLLEEELVGFYPELRGAVHLHRHLQIKRDFSAFHVGRHADRPSTVSPLRGVTFAGDWVKLPVPAMLLEAATVSALLAANAILDREGCAVEAIDTVPLRGLLAWP
jgi:isorenieratene synthase